MVVLSKCSWPPYPKNLSDICFVFLYLYFDNNNFSTAGLTILLSLAVTQTTVPIRSLTIQNVNLKNLKDGGTHTLMSHYSCSKCQYPKKYVIPDLLYVSGWFQNRVRMTKNLQFGHIKLFKWVQHMLLLYVGSSLSIDILVFLKISSRKGKFHT